MLPVSSHATLSQSLFIGNPIKDDYTYYLFYNFIIIISLSFSILLISMTASSHHVLVFCEFHAIFIAFDVAFISVMFLSSIFLQELN